MAYIDKVKLAGSDYDLHDTAAQNRIDDAKAWLAKEAELAALYVYAYVDRLEKRIAALEAQVS